MGDGHSALLVGDVYHVLADHRTRKCGEQRVLVLIKRIGLDGAGTDVLSEFLTHIDGIGSHRTQRDGLLGDGVDVGGTGLAQGSNSSHHLVTLFLKPRNQTGGVQAAGIGKHYFALGGRGLGGSRGSSSVSHEKLLREIRDNHKP